MRGPFSSNSVPKRQQAGFTLVSVLVAAGLMTLLALALATGFTDAFRLNHRLTQSTDAQAMVRAIQTLMTASPSVTKTFAGQPLPTSAQHIPIAVLNDGAGNALYRAPSILTSGLQLNSMELRPLLDQDPLSQIGNQVFVAELVLHFGADPSAPTTERLGFDRMIPIPFEYDAANRIIGLAPNAVAGANVEWVLENIPMCPADELLKGINPDGSPWCATVHAAP